MKQHPHKEKIINNQDERGITQADAKISAEASKKNEEKNKLPKFTMDDLKGKKVDGDPELESDKPIDQVKSGV